MAQRLITNGFVPLPWRLRSLVELIQGPAIPYGPRGDAKELAVMVERDGVWAIRLQLDGVDSGGRRGSNDLERVFEAATVVRGQLGDDECTRRCPSDEATVNDHRAVMSARHR